MNQANLRKEQEGFDYIPVLDSNGRVIGVVTPSSVINLLKDY